MDFNFEHKFLKHSYMFLYTHILILQEALILLHLRYQATVRLQCCHFTLQKVP